MRKPTVLAFATQGEGGNEEARIRELLRAFAPEVFAFDRHHKVRTFWRLFRTIRSHRPDLVVMEGSGIAGGLAVLLSRWLCGVRYVVSSGDAIGPWVHHHAPLFGPVFGLYGARPLSVGDRIYWLDALPGGSSSHIRYPPGCNGCGMGSLQKVCRRTDRCSSANPESPGDSRIFSGNWYCRSNRLEPALSVLLMEAKSCERWPA